MIPWASLTAQTAGAYWTAPALVLAFCLAVYTARSDLHWKTSWSTIAATAALMLCTGGLHMAGLPLMAAASLSTLLLVCGLIAETDRRHFVIPNSLVLALLILATTQVLGQATPLARLVGAAALGALFLAIHIAFKRPDRAPALGMGDVKLAAAIGALTGLHDGLLIVAGGAAATAMSILAFRARAGANAVEVASPLGAPFGVGLSTGLAMLCFYRFAIPA